MAAQTIAAQVAELVGTTVPASLDDWGGDAVNQLVLLLPYEHLAPFASSETVTYTGTYTELTTKNKRILEVSRKPVAGSVLNRVCKWCTPEQYVGELADSNSMFYPTDYDPRWTQYGNIVKVLPTVADMIVTSRYIALVATLDTTATSIDTLPYDCEYLVVLDLAERTASYKISLLALSALSSAAVLPPAPSAPSFITTDAFKYIVNPMTNTALTVYPIYLKPTMASLVALNATQVPPATPVITNATYTPVIANQVTASTIGTIPSVPTFTNTPVPGIVLAAASAFDSAMSNEDVELAGAQVQKLNQGLSQYQNEIQQNLGQFNKDLKKYDGDIQKIFEQAKLLEAEAQANAKTITDANLQNAAQVAATTHQNNANIIAKFQADVQAYGQRVNADVEIYSANMKRILDVYQADMVNEMNRVSSDIQTYQVALQKTIKQLDAIQSEYALGLQLYSAKLDSYGKQVQAEIGIYQSNVARNQAERDRYLALANKFRTEYMEHLAMKYGITFNMKGNNNGEPS